MVFAGNGNSRTLDFESGYKVVVPDTMGHDVENENKRRIWCKLRFVRVRGWWVLI